MLRVQCGHSTKAIQHRTDTLNHRKHCWEFCKQKPTRVAGQGKTSHSPFRVDEIQSKPPKPASNSVHAVKNTGTNFISLIIS